MKRKLEFWFLILFVLSPIAVAAVSLEHASTASASQAQETILDEVNNERDNPCADASAKGIPCTYIETEPFMITVPAPSAPLAAIPAPRQG